MLWKKKTYMRKIQDIYEKHGFETEVFEVDEYLHGRYFVLEARSRHRVIALMFSYKKDSLLFFYN
jgi:hypothetical protein